MRNLIGKTIAVLSLSAFGCGDMSSGEYLEQEITNCPCGAKIIEETRSTDDWLRLSEYITAKGESTGVAWEMVEEPYSTRCLEKSIYFFAETADSRTEIRYTDLDCDYLVDSLSYDDAVIPRELLGNSADEGFLEMEAEFDGKFNIERKTKEWHNRKGVQ